MNASLLRSCAGLWVLGLAGMWFARAVLVLEPHATPFKLAAALWILGGVGYTGLSVVALLSCARQAPEARSAVSLHR